MNKTFVFLKYLTFSFATVVTLFLSSCGGGGGKAGATGSGATTTTTTTTVSAGSLSLSLIDSSGNIVTSKTIAPNLTYSIQAVLKDATSSAVSYSRVTLTVDNALLAKLVPSNGTQLTDASGIAKLPISSADVLSQGVVVVSGTAKVNGTDVTASLDLQINAGQVGLSGLTVSPTTVSAGQSVNATVDVSVNGQAATANSVSVNYSFSSSCGTISPSAASVNNVGKATTVIQTLTTAAGVCAVTATSGSVSLTQSITVNPLPAIGLVFVSALPTKIYQKDSPGVTTSQVTFKLINQVGAGLSGHQIDAILDLADGGVDFCGVSTKNDLTKSDGTVTFAVCAGTLPTNVQVIATLNSNPSIYTKSNILTIQTGLPTQRFFDISATKLNFYAGGAFTSKYSGDKSSINVGLADRLGNPVPDGTTVTFISEGGLIISSGLSSCTIVNGACSVDLVGQEYRPLGSSVAGADPRPGRVTVLAYANGEEYFVDGNNNNRYDTGELFEDLGDLFIDKDEDGIWTPAYTSLAPTPVTNQSENPVIALPTAGSAACPTNANVGLSKANTCNGVWDKNTKIRRTITIVFSGGEICQPTSYDASIPGTYKGRVIRTSTTALSSTYVEVVLADCDGNPLPQDTTVTAASDTPCTPTLISGNLVGNTTNPTYHAAKLDTCSGSYVRFEATVNVPGGGSKTTSYSVLIP